MVTARELSESAYAHCVTGNMTACLRDLDALMPLSAITRDERHEILHLLDSIAAMLPQRLQAACGVAVEAECLGLLRELCDDGLIGETDTLRPLAVGLLHGVRHPLQEDELPAQLLTHARLFTTRRSQARRYQQENVQQIFASTLRGGALAQVISSIAPIELSDQPGNVLACMLGITAAVDTDMPSDGRRLVLLDQGIRLAELRLFKIDKADVDQRALVHLMFHIFRGRHRMATLRGDKESAVAAIIDLHRLALLARQTSLPEEAWFILAFVARVSLVNQQLADALRQAEECRHLHTANLAHIINLAATPSKRHDLALRRCWTAVRQTFASLGTIGSPASRWRAAIGEFSLSLNSLELFTLLDRVRWHDPGQWTQALLPIFLAHPYEWREFPASTTFRKVPVNLVLTCGDSGVWVTNPTNSLEPIQLPRGFRERLWQNAVTAVSMKSISENITDAMVSDASQLAEAGLFPAIREFNNAIRSTSLERKTSPDHIDALADVASAKLDSLYESLRPLQTLAPADGEFIATAGSLSLIPWERSFGKHLETACVCLHPRSTGASRVEIPDIQLTASSPVGILGDGADLDQAHLEIEAIREIFGTCAEAFPGGSLDSFQEAARRCHIVHVAAHGIQAWRDPRLNVLTFRNGELSARDLAHLDLTTVKLVVVNACEAAAPGIGSLAGEATIVGALLAAGASAVIGALWSIEDECAAVFASALYRALAAGEPLTNAYHSACRALRSHVVDEFGRDHSFMSDAYRLFIRGLGT